MKKHYQPLFSMNRVEFRHAGGIIALGGIDLEVQAGEQLALLGANGSGKTTLLHLLNGVIFPTAGRYVAFGEDITEAKVEEPQFRRLFRTGVGLVFQDADTQLFSATVYEEIAYGPLQLDLSEKELRQRVEDLLTLFGIQHLRDRSPHELSGGEKRKVAIASVLAVNPQALLLDEPTAGLDPRSQSWLVRLLGDLAAAGKTIVIATHDLSLAGRFASRAIVLGEDHRIAAIGKASDILADHALLVRCNLVEEDAAPSDRPARSTTTPFQYPFAAPCKKKPL